MFRFLFVFVMMLVPCLARAAVCSAGYYLLDGNCVVCNTNTSPYYCPGDDLRYGCPGFDTAEYVSERYGGELVGTLGRYTPGGGREADVYQCYARYEVELNGGVYVMEAGWDGAHYGNGNRYLYFRALNGYYLSPYRGTSYMVWYNGVKACTNAPENATYTGPGTPDSTDGTIVDANDCPWVCNPGYYLANDTCVICPAGYKCADGVKTACTGATYQDETGQTSCKSCPTATHYADKVTSYFAWTASGVYTSSGQCYATFHNTTSATNGSISALRCEYCGADGDYGVGCDCDYYVTKCKAGYYSPVGANFRASSSFVAALADACVEVGAGYWSPADSLERVECTNAPENATYTSGAESNNCPWVCNDDFGRTAADTCAPLCTAGITTLNTSTGIRAPLFAVANTSPAIHIKNNNGTCHADLIPGTGENAIHIRYNGQVYHTMNVNK